MADDAPEGNEGLGSPSSPASRDYKSWGRALFEPVASLLQPQSFIKQMWSLRDAALHNNHEQLQKCAQRFTASYPHWVQTGVTNDSSFVSADTVGALMKWVEVVCQTEEGEVAGSTVLDVVATLKLLCEFEGNRETVVQNSVHFLDLLRTHVHDVELLLQGVTVLKLCLSSEPVECFGDPTAVVLFMLLSLKMHPSCEDVQQNAMHSLGSCAAAAQSASFIVDSGAVQSAVQAMRRHGSRDSVQWAALNLLRSLSVHRALVLPIVNCGVVPTLMATLQRFGSNNELQMLGLATLANISAVDELVELLMTQKCVDQTISAIQQHENDSRVVEHGMLVLAHVARDPRYAGEVMEAGAINMSVALMTKQLKQPNMMVCCLKLVASIALHESYHSLVVTVGMISRALLIIQLHPTVLQVQQAGLRTLANIASGNPCRAQVVEAGAFKAAMVVLKEHPTHADLQACALQLLANIAKSSEKSYHEMLVALESHVHAFAAIINHPLNELVQACSLSLLAQLLKHTTGRVSGTSALAAAQGALQKGIAQGPACACLYSVARYCPDGDQQVVASGVVERVSPSFPNGLELLERVTSHGPAEQQQDAALTFLLGGHIGTLYHPPVAKRAQKLQATLEQFPVAMLKPLLRSHTTGETLRLHLTLATLYLTGLHTTQQLADFMAAGRGLELLMRLLAEPDQAQRMLGARAISHTVERTGCLDGDLHTPSLDAARLRAIVAANTSAAAVYHGESADVKFVFDDGRSLSAHRGLLSSALGMDVYTNILKHSNTIITSTAGMVNISGVSFTAFACLMSFLYTGLLQSLEEEEGSPLPVSLVAEVFVVAGRYQISKLQQVCAGRIVRELTVPEVSTVWEKLMAGASSNGNDMDSDRSNSSRGNKTERACILTMREDISVFILQNIEDVVQDETFSMNQDWMLKLINLKLRALLKNKRDKVKNSSFFGSSREGGLVEFLSSPLRSFSSQSLFTPR